MHAPPDTGPPEQAGLSPYALRHEETGRINVCLTRRMVSGESFWAAQARFQDDRHVAYAAKLLESADALVLGRPTYEVFAASWPGRTARWQTGSTRCRSTSHRAR